MTKGMGIEAAPMVGFTHGSHAFQAMVCLGHGVYRISGVPRMHERPQKEIPSEHAAGVCGWQPWKTIWFCPRIWGIFGGYWMIPTPNIPLNIPKLQISGKDDDQPWHFGVPYCKHTRLSRIIVFLADFYCLMGGNPSWHCVRSWILRYINIIYIYI